MKKFLLVLTVFAFGVYLFGCSKKETAQEEAQTQLSMEALSTTGANTPATAEVKAASDPAAAKLEPLPPTGPYKPTTQEIQLALKNASFYTGAIDGKLGPMTRKAIADFQKANGLNADGKVGPKTWEALSKYLTQDTSAKSKKGRS